MPRPRPRRLLATAALLALLVAAAEGLALANRARVRRDAAERMRAAGQVALVQEQLYLDQARRHRAGGDDLQAALYTTLARDSAREAAYFDLQRRRYDEAAARPWSPLPPPERMPPRKAPEPR